MKTTITYYLAALLAALLRALSRPEAGRLCTADAASSLDACRPTIQYVFVCAILFPQPTVRNGVY